MNHPFAAALCALCFVAFCGMWVDEYISAFKGFNDMMFAMFGLGVVLAMYLWYSH